MIRLINFITHYKDDSIFCSKQNGHHSQGYIKFKKIAKKYGFKVVENQPIVNNSIVIFRDLPKPGKVANKPENCIFILHIWESPLQRQFLFNERNWGIFDRVLSSNDKVKNSKHRILKYYVDSYNNNSVNIDFEDRKFSIAVNSNRYSGLLSSRKGSGVKSLPFFQEMDFDWHNNIKETLFGGLNELYSFRRKMLQKKHLFFDLYGKFWECRNFPSWVGKFHPIMIERFESKGELFGDKRELMSKYKYAMAFENYKNDFGYISEKIFECLQSGCVPLYAGCSNIADYIPQECFIYVDLNSEPSELRSRLELISKDRWLDYVEAGRDFLESAEFYDNFSAEAFSSTLMKYILELTPR